MMASTTQPAESSRFQRFQRALRRAWLIHRITWLQLDIRSLQRLIDNDVAVVRRYPDLQNKVLPEIDARFMEQEVARRRLKALRGQLALEFGQ